MRLILLFLSVVFFGTSVYSQEITAKTATCFPPSSFCTGYEITNVKIVGTTLNNSTTVCPPNGMSSFPFYTVAVSAGATYTLITQVNGNVIGSVWFDDNNNLNYDPSEWQQICTSSTPGATFATVFTISPSFPINNTYSFRIRTRTSGTQNGAGDACTAFGTGELEDYAVCVCVGTEINEESVRPRLTVFPNPAESYVNISYYGNSDNMNLEIYDCVGRLVLNKPLTLSKEKSEVRIELDGFDKGMYQIQLKSPKGVVLKKLILGE